MPARSSTTVAELIARADAAAPPHRSTLRSVPGPLRRAGVRAEALVLPLFGTDRQRPVRLATGTPVGWILLLTLQPTVGQLVEAIARRDVPQEMCVQPKRIKDHGTIDLFAHTGTHFVWQPYHRALVVQRTSSIVAAILAGLRGSILLQGIRAETLHRVRRGMRHHHRQQRPAIVQGRAGRGAWAITQSLRPFRRRNGPHHRTRGRISTDVLRLDRHVANKERP